MGEHHQEYESGAARQTKHGRLGKCLTIGLIGVMIQAAIIVLAVHSNTHNTNIAVGLDGALRLQGPHEVTAGDTFTLTLTVTNTSEFPGDAFIGVFTSITQGVTLGDTPPDCTPNIQSSFVGIDCTSTVSANASSFFNVFFKIDVPGDVAFLASGSFNFPPFSDFVSPGIAITANSPPIPSPELSIRKDSTPSIVQAGQNLTYTIAITNTGVVSLTNGVISDTMPDGLTLINVAANQGSCTQVADSVTCSADTIPPNSLYEVTLTSALDPAFGLGSLTNTAFFSATGFTSLAIDTATTPVTAPDIDGNGTDDNADPHIGYAQTLSGTYFAYLAPEGITLDVATRILTVDEQLQGNIAGGGQVITLTVNLTGTNQVTVTNQTDVQIVTPRPANIYLPIIFKSAVGPQTNSLSTTRANGASTTTANTYLKFGRTPDNPTPHFYLFNFDGETGVVGIEANVITLRLVDGKRGDDDLTVNGVIIDPGAPAFVASEAAMAAGANTPQDKTATKGSLDVAMLQFAAGAPNMATRLESVIVGASGTGDDAADVTAVKVYLDANGDGQVDNGDTQLASGTFSADNGNVTLPLNPVQDIAANGSANFLVAYDFNTVLTVAAAPSGARLARSSSGLVAQLPGTFGLLALAPILLVIPLLVSWRRIGRTGRLIVVALLMVSALGVLEGCFGDDGDDGQGQTFTATLNGVTATNPGAGGGDSAVTGVPVTGATVSVR